MQLLKEINPSLLSPESSPAESMFGLQLIKPGKEKQTTVLMLWMVQASCRLGTYLSLHMLTSNPFYKWGQERLSESVAHLEVTQPGGAGNTGL